ncbi:MAG TPA: hypothetical protein VGB45_01110 [Abditibacterium sp.]|jgi:glutamine phosphoribosylpyrophosphate amidotransferase
MKEKLEILHLLLELTRQGKLVWTRFESDLIHGDEYNGQLGEHKLWAEFIYFARTDEVGSDRHMLRFRFNNGLEDYCIGTEGFDLICEMLAHSSPDWLQGSKRANERLPQTIQLLKQMLVDQ